MSTLYLDCKKIYVRGITTDPAVVGVRLLRLGGLGWA